MAHQMCVLLCTINEHNPHAYQRTQHILHRSLSVVKRVHLTAYGVGHSSVVSWFPSSQPPQEEAAVHLNIGLFSGHTQWGCFAYAIKFSILLRPQGGTAISALFCLFWEFSKKLWV